MISKFEFSISDLLKNYPFKMKIRNRKSDIRN